MEKIVEITSEDWLTGMTSQVNNPKTPYVDPSSHGVSATDFPAKLENYGVLGVGSKPYSTKYKDNNSNYQNFDKELLAGTPIEDVQDVLNADEKQFLYDEDGNLYTSDYPKLKNNIKSYREGDPFADPAAGLSSFLKKDGTQYLLYPRKASLGRHEIGSNTYSDSWGSFSSSTEQRPMFKYQDRVYIGNENEVAMVSESSGSMNFQTNVLDLPGTDKIIDFSSQGKYLVIASSNANIYFWDTNADSWQKRREIKDTFGGLHKVVNIDGDIIALLNSGLWFTGFSTPVQPIFEFGYNADLPPGVSGNSYGTIYGQASADTARGRLYWATFEGGVAMYDHREQTVHTPFIGLDPLADELLLISATQTTLGVAQHDSGDTYVDYYIIDDTDYDPDVTDNSTEDARQAQSNSYIQTRTINMEDTYQVKMVEVLLEEELSGDDSLGVEVYIGNQNDYFDFGTIDKNSKGRKIQLYHHSGLNYNTAPKPHSDTISVYFNFEAGNPRVRSVSVWGDEITK